MGWALLPRRLPVLLIVVAVAAPTGSSQHEQAPEKHPFYGNPMNSPCRPGEINVTLKGVPGIFCSPPCSASQECPSLSNRTLAPPGINYPTPPKIFGQIFDQYFGQGFDQGLGEGKCHEYSVQFYPA